MFPVERHVSFLSDFSNDHVDNLPPCDSYHENEYGSGSQLRPRKILAWGFQRGAYTGQITLLHFSTLRGQRREFAPLDLLAPR